MPKLIPFDQFILTKEKYSFGGYGSIHQGTDYPFRDLPIKSGAANALTVLFHMKTCNCQKRPLISDKRKSVLDFIHLSLQVNLTNIPEHTSETRIETDQ